MSNNDTRAMAAANKLLREEVENLRNALRQVNSNLKELESKVDHISRRSSGDPLALLPGTCVKHRVRSERRGIIISEPDSKGQVDVDFGFAAFSVSVYALELCRSEDIDGTHQTEIREQTQSLLLPALVLIAAGIAAIVGGAAIWLSS